MRLAGVLNRGRVQVSGGIGDLLATHRLLTGPVEPADQGKGCRWFADFHPADRY